MSIQHNRCVIDYLELFLLIEPGCCHDVLHHVMIVFKNITSTSVGEGIRDGGGCQQQRHNIINAMRANEWSIKILAP